MGHVFIKLQYIRKGNKWGRSDTNKTLESWIYRVFNLKVDH